MKTKTLDELEAENPEGFRNPASTPEEDARDQRRWEAQRIANEALPDVPEVEEEEEEDEDEYYEVEDEYYEVEDEYYEVEDEYYEVEDDE